MTALRSIVRIDENKCNGCGLCVPSCAEGAIQIIDGKARLVADHLCDGLGACLGDCPEGAISIEDREAEAFDETAVEHHLGTTMPAVIPMAAHRTHEPTHGAPGGCPGSRMLRFDDNASPSSGTAATETGPMGSELRQWPVQLHLVSPTAPYFQHADILLAADCVAFSVGDFHRAHLKGKALAIACPKLDEGQSMYLNKIVTMIDEAKINTLTVMVMEVPCCGGLLSLAREAVHRSQRKVPLKKVVVGLRGNIVAEEWI